MSRPLADKSKKFYKIYQDGKKSSLTEERIEVLESMGVERTPPQGCRAKAPLVETTSLARGGDHTHNRVRISKSNFVCSPKQVVKREGLQTSEREGYKNDERGAAPAMTTRNGVVTTRGHFAREQDPIWWNMYERLSAFRRAHGNVIPTDGELTDWIKTQRRAYANRMCRQNVTSNESLVLSSSKTYWLAKLGFAFDPEKKYQMTRGSWLRQLERYNQEFSNYHVPKNPKRDEWFYPLSGWIQMQRCLYLLHIEGRLSTITRHDFEDLKQKGVVGDVDDSKSNGAKGLKRNSAIAGLLVFGADDKICVPHKGKQRQNRSQLTMGSSSASTQVRAGHTEENRLVAEKIKNGARVAVHRPELGAYIEGEMVGWKRRSDFYRATFRFHDGKEQTIDLYGPKKKFRLMDGECMKKPLVTETKACPTISRIIQYVDL
uniref:Helicase-associated domain-containing protein n=1 Tax=Odontella aurita TaxID=265563 RepID=A0A7S4J0Z4_9STRA|mmetsp:Transcript_35328/g.105519  ORF Transcript_35328/g.105519 Transcript_35328/m.105519 type:complete len:432 (+) Transcript_35328:354-1649(+)